MRSLTVGEETRTCSTSKAASTLARGQEADAVLGEPVEEGEGVVAGVEHQQAPCQGGGLRGRCGACVVGPDAQQVAQGWQPALVVRGRGVADPDPDRELAREVEHGGTLTPGGGRPGPGALAQQPDLPEDMLQGRAIDHPDPPEPRQGTRHGGRVGADPARRPHREGRQGLVQHRLEQLRRQAPQPLAQRLLAHPARRLPEEVVARQQAGQPLHRWHLPPDQRHQQRHHHRQRQHPPAQPGPPILLRHRVRRRPHHLGQPRIHFLTRRPRRRARTNVISIPLRLAAMRPGRQLAHPVVFAYSARP